MARMPAKSRFELDGRASGSPVGEYGKDPSSIAFLANGPGSNPGPGRWRGKQEFEWKSENAFVQPWFNMPVVRLFSVHAYKRFDSDFSGP